MKNRCCTFVKTHAPAKEFGSITDVFLFELSGLLYMKYCQIDVIEYNFAVLHEN